VDEHAIKTAVEQRYGIRLEIDNDLNCAARAEAAYWNSTHLAAMYVGTGIGAAVIENTRLIRGSRNLSYEIGHIPYRDAPFVCGCGRMNCLELYASGSGMAKWLEHHGESGNADLNRFRHSENPFKQTIVQEFEYALMQGVGTLVTLANPHILVLGGGIVRENPYLVRLVKENIEKFALQGAVEGLRIVMSRLDNGSLEGAKLLEKMDG
jgi:glucokinase